MMAETDVKIISIEFDTSEENHAQFFGQVIVDVEADAIERIGSVKGDVVILAVAVNEIDGSSGENPGNTSQIGNIVEQTVSVELPVVWSEDGQDLVHFTFEMNDEVILPHHPCSQVPDTLCDFQEADLHRRINRLRQNLFSCTYCFQKRCHLNYT